MGENKLEVLTGVYGSVAPIWRDNAEGVGSVTWGRVCGRAKLLRRDASLPAIQAAMLGFSF